MAGDGDVKPYFDDGRIQIWHGDCRDVLPLLEPHSFDVCLTDPPYGETSLEWDACVAGWPSLVRACLKHNGSLWVFTSLRSLLQTHGDYGDFRLIQELIWEKHNGSIFHADRFRRVHELLTHWCPRWVDWAGIYKNPQFTRDATKHTMWRKQRPTHSGAIGASTYVSEDGGPRLMRSVLQVRSCHGVAVHPTQKPEGIIRPALSYSLPPGGLVLDPFAGSGTTLIVAREMGARAVGIEISEAYCEIAVTRLQQSVLPLGVV